MSESVQVTFSDEIAAVESGEIEGCVYQDGECWADALSLLQWRHAKIIAAPALPSAVVSAV